MLMQFQFNYLNDVRIFRQLLEIRLLYLTLPLVCI